MGDTVLDCKNCGSRGAPCVVEWHGFRDGIRCKKCDIEWSLKVRDGKVVRIYRPVVEDKNGS